MSGSDVVISAVEVSAPATGVARRALWRRVLRNPVGLGCCLVLAVIIVAGLFAPLLSPYNPSFARLELSNIGPFKSGYLLGGDQYGRDILSRLLDSTLGTLEAAALMVLIAAGLGTLTGLVAGYYGGLIEDVTEWIANVVMALPGFVLLIALFPVIGPRIFVAMAVLGVLIAPIYFRLVRSLVRAVRSELYIDSARVSGLGDYRIIVRHVLRSIRGPIVVQSAFVMAIGISLQAALGFLGLGDPNKPSWGGMLQDGFNNIYASPTAVLWPALLIGVTTLCLVLLGNVVSDEMTAASSRHKPLNAATRRRLQAEARTENPEPAPAKREDGPPALLAVRGLTLGYPDSRTSVRAVVNDVDLTVERGEVHGLVGESGSGKSQTVASILGILPPEAVILRGSVTYRGADLLRDGAALRKARGRRIAYVPQEPMSNLDPAFTIGQQLTYGLRAVKDISVKQAHSDLVALLDRVGIKEPRKVFAQYPHQISGGMAQRVLIAGALAGEPELLVADEPTTALDVTVQADVLDLLRALQRELDLGMLLVTHNFGVVADICDRVSVMQAGAIVESRPVKELFADPSHTYTQLLLASMPEAAGVRRELSTMKGTP